MCTASRPEPSTGIWPRRGSLSGTTGRRFHRKLPLTVIAFGRSRRNFFSRLMMSSRASFRLFRRLLRTPLFFSGLGALSSASRTSSSVSHMWRHSLHPADHRATFGVARDPDHRLRAIVDAVVDEPHAERTGREIGRHVYEGEENRDEFRALILPSCSMRSSHKSAGSVPSRSLCGFTTSTCRSSARQVVTGSSAAAKPASSLSATTTMRVIQSTRAILGRVDEPPDARLCSARQRGMPAGLLSKPLPKQRSARSWYEFASPKAIGNGHATSASDNATQLLAVRVGQRHALRCRQPRDDAASAHRDVGQRQRIMEGSQKVGPPGTYVSSALSLRL